MPNELRARTLQFVHDWIANGQNGTLAAKTAGFKGNDVTLAVTASRLLKTDKVKQAIQQLTGKAIARSERSAIASLEECLEFLTVVKRSRQGDYLRDDGEADIAKIKAAPEGLIRKVKVKSTTDENGQVYAQHEIELESAADAAKTLIKHHTAQAGQIAAGALADAIRTLPAEAVVMIARSMLSGPKPIDVTARQIG